MSSGGCRRARRGRQRPGCELMVSGRKDLDLAQFSLTRQLKETDIFANARNIAVNVTTTTFAIALSEGFFVNELLPFEKKPLAAVHSCAGISRCVTTC